METFFGHLVEKGRSEFAYQNTVPREVYRPKRPERRRLNGGCCVNYVSCSFMTYLLAIVRMARISRLS
jgi:hypothetical protein